MDFAMLSSPCSPPAIDHDCPSFKLTDLRSLLRERFPAAHSGEQNAPAPAPAGEPLSGVGEFDALQPPSGDLTEIVSRQPGRGGALLLHQLILRAAGRGQPVALVDGSDSFDPGSWPVGADCGRLLWLRCRAAEEGVRAVDLLLRDGNLDLLLLDLQLNSPADVARVPASSWYRLRMLLRNAARRCLVFTSAQTVPRAGLRVELARPLSIEAQDCSRMELADRLQVRPLRRGRGAVAGSGDLRHAG